MSAETDLYAVLASSTALAALVGNRVYPDAIPEDQAPPAVVYQRTLSMTGCPECDRLAQPARAKETAQRRRERVAAAAEAQIAALPPAS